MSIFKNWSAWEDISVREASDGTHYLLQMKTSDDGEKKFKNRRIDHDGVPYILFHGFQGIIDKIVK